MSKIMSKILSSRLPTAMFCGTPGVPKIYNKVKNTYIIKWEKVLFPELLDF